MKDKNNISILTIKIKFTVILTRKKCKNKIYYKLMNSGKLYGSRTYKLVSYKKKFKKIKQKIKRLRSKEQKIKLRYRS